MAKILTTLLVLLQATAVTSIDAEDFSYNPCGRDGPQHWTGKCQIGVEQSPIDLCNEKVMDYRREIALEVPKQIWKVTNNGHSVVFLPSETSTLSIGNIAFLVGRSSNNSTISWKLHEIHCHLGKNGGQDGSEHALHGKKFPMECHAVHYNGKYKNFKEALASKAGDQILVLGFFFEVKPQGSAFLDEMSQYTRLVLKEQKETKEITMDWIKNINDYDYHAYNGALTVPPCGEIVTWVVINTPMVVSKKAFEKFKIMHALPDASEVLAEFGTRRPLQPHHSRTIYSTSNTIKKCGPVKSETCPTNVPLAFIFVALPSALLVFSILLLRHSNANTKRRSMRESSTPLQSHEEYMPPKV